MALHSGFFDGKLARARDFNNAIAGLISSGVRGFDASELQIVANSGMVISAKVGYAWFKSGSHIYNDGDYNLTVETADGVLDRIDRVVARENIITGESDILIIKGELSDNPVAPDIVEDGTYSDLGLSLINVPHGTIEITQDLITDTRFDESVCGQVYAIARKIKTAGVFAQYDAEFHQLIESMAKDKHVEITVNSDAASIKGTPVSDIPVSTENLYPFKNPVTGEIEWGEVNLIPKEELLLDQTITFTPTEYTTNIDVSAYKGKYKYLKIAITATGTNIKTFLGINYGEATTKVVNRTMDSGYLIAYNAMAAINGYALIGRPYFANGNYMSQTEIDCYGTIGKIKKFSTGRISSGSYGTFMDGSYISNNGLNTLTFELQTAPTENEDIIIKIWGVK